MRSLVRLAIRGLLLGIIALLAAYLLRRPLFEGLVARLVARELGAALDAEVEIEGIGGNWLTYVRLHGIRIRGRGVVAAVDRGDVAVEVRPLALIGGDLAGLHAARISADRVRIDLTAEATAAAPPTPPGSPFDPSTLIRLLPDGATVEVRSLELAGSDETLAGGLEAALRADAAAPRQLRVAYAGLRTTVNLLGDGRLAAKLTMVDAARVPKLFAPVPGLEGGLVAGEAELLLAPTFQCRVDADVVGLRVRDRLLGRCEVRGTIDDSGVNGVSADLAAPGAIVWLNGASLRWDQGLASLIGEAVLDLRDVTPYADLVPAEAQPWLPNSGWLRLRAADGWLHVGDGQLENRALRVRTLAGGMTLRRDAVATAAPRPLQLAVDIVDAAALPLPELPLRIDGGSLRCTIGRADTLITAGVELDLRVADAGGRSGQIGGRCGVEIGDAVRLTPDLSVTGPLLRDLAPSLAVRADAEVAGSRLTVQSLSAGPGGQPPALLAQAAVDLADTSPKRLLATASADVRASGFELDPWLVLLGVTDLGGSVTGRIELAGGIAGADVTATLRGLEPTRPERPAALRIDCQIDDAGVTVRTLRAEIGEGLATIAASGSVLGRGLVDWMTSPIDLAALRADVSATLNAPDLAAIDVSRFAAVTLAGTVDGAAQLRGDLAAPRPTLSLDLAGVDVDAGPGLPTVRRCRGSVSVSPTELRLTALHLEVDGQAWSLDGSVRRDAGSLATEMLTVGGPDGGLLRVAGRIGDPLAGDAMAAIGGSGDVRVELERFSFAPWLRLTGLPADFALANGWLVWRRDPATDAAGTLEGTVDARVTGLQAVDRTLDLTAHLSVRGNREGTGLGDLTVDVGSLHVAGNVMLPGVTPAALITDAPRAVASASLAGELQTTPCDITGWLPFDHGFDELSGQVELIVDASGRLIEPTLAGTLTVTGGRFRAPGGQRLDDIDARFRLSTSSIEIAELVATRGAGPLQVSGSISAPGPLWREWPNAKVDLRSQGDDVLLYRKRGIKVRADYDLTVAGPLANLDVGGLVALHSSKVVTRVPLLDFRSVGGAATTSGLPLPTFDLGPHVGGQLGVRVTTADAVSVDSNVFAGGLEARLEVVGPISAPLLRGTVSGADGNLILPGLRLRATSMLVYFSQDQPRFPTVAITARGRRHGYDVQVVVRGRYDDPEIVLSSEPPLPAEDLVVLVTTGARPSTLRGARGVGTALGAYVAEELADWIFGSESTEAKETFLSRFTLETGTEISRSGNESIVVEFKILDNVFLQGERDIYEDINMGLVYRVRFR